MYSTVQLSKDCKAALAVLLYFNFNFLRPSGHIDTLFPEPCRMRYAITHISSFQFAQSIDCRLVQVYKTPNSCGEGLLCNLFGVRPIPTRYSLYALNPVLPGLEPGPTDEVCVISGNWACHPLAPDKAQLPPGPA